MNRPNFSGTWKFNPQKSKLQIQSPDSTTFIIEHNEPDFKLTRTHIFSGKSDTFSITLNTDGNKISFHHRGLEINAKLYWIEDMLVFDSIINRDNEIATNIVKYRLEDQGKTFIAEEKLSSSDQNYTNIWVLEKYDQEISQN